MVQGERFDQLKRLDDLEVSLVRQVLEHPNLLSSDYEAAIRQAIAVARLHRIEGEGGTVLVEDLTEKLRAEVHTLLDPQLGPGRVASGQALGAVAPLLQNRARRVHADVAARLAGRVEPAALDREIHEKALVLVCGGGGGTGYVHLGAFTLLEELGQRPQLLVGSSMGAVMGLFRARKASFDTGEMVSVLRSISYRKIFRVLSMESRYGLPAALRLYLRAAIGRHFPTESGAPLRLSDLAVPMIVTVSAIRKGSLPKPLEFYERLLSLRDLSLLSPTRLRHKVVEVMNAVAELAQMPDLLELHLGAEPETLEFDALDAVGFSCALPGVIHYDVIRDDARMHQMLSALFERHEIFRLFDGGVTDNVSARAAWRAVHQGRIGTRNALVVALDGFAPKLNTPLWLPLQRIANHNVEQNLPFAHFAHRFARSLSPLELVPSVDNMLGIARRAREELLPSAPFLRRMLTRLPSIDVSVGPRAAAATAS
jgi:predicted acylesterase/phospholipase RssA